MHCNNENDFWGNTDSVHPDLLATKNLVFDPNQFNCSQPKMETESAEYGAYTFELNGQAIIYRAAKTTPTKIGQFVTLWKRISKSPIQPFDSADSVDFIIISTRTPGHFGQFVFPKSVLCEQDIISVKEEGGKRAIRVYPPWDKTISKQAQKTQKWQLKYFLQIPEDKSIDTVRSKILYGLI
jgi:hypothetical protein